MPTPDPKTPRKRTFASPSDPSQSLTIDRITGDDGERVELIFRTPDGASRFTFGLKSSRSIGRAIVAIATEEPHATA